MRKTRSCGQFRLSVAVTIVIRKYVIFHRFNSPNNLENRRPSQNVSFFYVFLYKSKKNVFYHIKSPEITLRSVYSIA